MDILNPMHYQRVFPNLAGFLYDLSWFFEIKRGVVCSVLDAIVIIYSKFFFNAAGEILRKSMISSGNLHLSTLSECRE